MTIIKVRHTANFTHISNTPIKDTRLSCEALGVLLYLMSKPDDWTVRPSQLQERFSVGRDKIRNTLNLLEETGYIKREKVRVEETGLFTASRYIVSDAPMDTSPRNPETENPSLDDPAPENPTLLKTDDLLRTDCNKLSSPDGDQIDQEFEQWWSDQYPDREGTHSKAKAKAKYIAFRRKGVSKDAIWQATDQYFRELVEQERLGTRFVKHATTFLNDQPWVR